MFLRMAEKIMLHFGFKDQYDFALSMVATEMLCSFTEVPIGQFFETVNALNPHFIETKFGFKAFRGLYVKTSMEAMNLDLPLKDPVARVPLHQNIDRLLTLVQDPSIPSLVVPQAADRSRGAKNQDDLLRIQQIKRYIAGQRT